MLQLPQLVRGPALVLTLTGCIPICTTRTGEAVVTAIVPVDLEVDPVYDGCGEFVEVTVTGGDAGNTFTTFRKVLDEAGVEEGSSYEVSWTVDAPGSTWSCGSGSAELPEELRLLEYTADEVKADKGRGDPISPEIDCGAS